jgi:hypothetical protein
MSKESTPTPDLDKVLRQLRGAIVKHPFAAQSLHSALVREGRAYGQTVEGRRLREQLLRSEMVTRLRTAWEVMTFGALGEPTTGALPSLIAEAFVQSVLRTGFESRLQSGLCESDRNASEDGDGRQ